MRIGTQTNQVDLFLPKIEIKKRLKKVIVSGRSRMPDPGEYYNDFANTLSDYFYEFNKTLFIEFYFDYVNTGSSKWLVFVMQYLESVLTEQGGMIEVTWKFDSDDEAIQETGEVLRSQLSFPVVLKEVELWH
jgi:hypothetical protein